MASQQELRYDVKTIVEGAMGFPSVLEDVDGLNLRCTSSPMLQTRRWPHQSSRRFTTLTESVGCVFSMLNLALLIALNFVSISQRFLYVLMLSALKSRIQRYTSSILSIVLEVPFLDSMLNSSGGHSVVHHGSMKTLMSLLPNCQLVLSMARQNEPFMGSRWKMMRVG